MCIRITALIFIIWWLENQPVCVLYSVPSIVHPSPSVFYHGSFIMYPLPCIFHHRSFVVNPLPYVSFSWITALDGQLVSHVSFHPCKHKTWVLETVYSWSGHGSRNLKRRKAEFLSSQNSSASYSSVMSHGINSHQNREVTRQSNRRKEIQVKGGGVGSANQLAWGSSQTPAHP